MVTFAFALSAKIKFSVLRLRHQIYVISGLAKRTNFIFIFFFFGGGGGAICSLIFSQYIGMDLQTPKHASARKIYFLRKTMNVTMTSNIGIWESIFYLHYVNHVAYHQMR